MIISPKKTIALMALMLQVITAAAQITITGKVTDAENGETVPGVGVSAGKTVTVTDDRGVYTLVLANPSDPLKITYSCIGYVSKDVTVADRRSQTVDVVLSQDQKLLREIVVNGRPHDFGVRSPQMAAVALSQTQIKNLPVVFGEPDLLKTLQTTPGVQSGRTGNAGIMVRGGYFDQNSLMIDGAALYSSEHMRGFVSAVNPDFISNLAFYRGAFPAKYSGRLSGIIDITAKEGDFYQYHGELNVGTAMGRLNISGPIIKGKTTFSVAARMSYFGLMYQKIVQHHYDKINKQCPYSDMEFWDVNAKLTHKFSEFNRLSLTFVKDHDKQTMPGRGGTSTSTSVPYWVGAFGLGYPSTYEPTEGECVGTYDTNGYNKPTGDEMRWGNTLGALNWQHRWAGSDKNLNVTLAMTEYDYKRQQQGITSSEKVIKFTAARPDSVISRYYDDSTVGSYSNVRNLRASASMIQPLGEHNTLVYGADFRHSWFKPGRSVKSHIDEYRNWSVWNGTTGQILIDHRDELTITDFDSVNVNRQKLSTVNVFVGDDLNFNRFRANVGVNLAMYIVPGKTYFYAEPRLTMSYMVARNTSVKASATQISQAERLLSTVSLVAPSDIWVPATDSVPPMRSTQFNLGINHQFPYGIDFSVEGYYKTGKGNIDYLEGTNFNEIATTWERQITIGKSRSYGVEVLLQKFSGSLNGWISYTWSRSFDKYDAPGKSISNGMEIPALADRPHNLSVNLSQRVGGIQRYPRNHFDFSLLFKYMSGRRVTLPDYVAYSGMMTIADHYYKAMAGTSWKRFGQTTTLIGTVTLPSEAFDIFMRYNGYSERYNYILPYEMTLDLNVSFTMGHRFGESKIALGVTNVLNRKNVSNIYMGTFADGKKVIVGVCDFPIMPSLSYTYSF